MLLAFWISFSVVTYGLMGILVGAASYKIQKARGSMEPEFFALLWGGLWPVCIWILLGAKIILRIDDKEEKREALRRQKLIEEAERQRILEDAMKELDSTPSRLKLPPDPPPTYPPAYP